MVEGACRLPVPAQVSKRQAQVVRCDLGVLHFPWAQRGAVLHHRLSLPAGRRQLVSLPRQLHEGTRPATRDCSLAENAQL